MGSLGKDCCTKWGLKNIFLFSKALVAKGGWRILNSSSLWTKVVVKKYIESILMETWIRSSQKSLKGASVIWKAIINAFPVIENGLAWKIGNGQHFRLGKDPWSGCEGQHILSDQLLHHLNTKGIETLNNLVEPRLTTIWSQGWKEENRLGLDDDEVLELERYINLLKITQIRLRDREDELIWDTTPSGIYTPKLGYLKLNSDLLQRESVWWWGKLWKLNCPAKTRLFMWNVLNNKVSTWDILQKRNFLVQDGVLSVNLKENLLYISF
jgi:hypothetical protein